MVSTPTQTKPPITQHLGEMQLHQTYARNHDYPFFFLRTTGKTGSIIIVWAIKLHNNQNGFALKG